MEAYGIAAFRSRQQVMRYESIFQRAGIATSVISTPRDVSAGCGLSLRFHPNDLGAVQDILRRSRPTNLIGVYLVDQTTNGRARLMAVTR